MIEISPKSGLFYVETFKKLEALAQTHNDDGMLDKADNDPSKVIIDELVPSGGDSLKMEARMSLGGRGLDRVTISKGDSRDQYSLSLDMYREGYLVTEKTNSANGGGIVRNFTVGWEGEVGKVTTEPNTEEFLAPPSPRDRSGAIRQLDRTFEAIGYTVGSDF